MVTSRPQSSPARATLWRMLTGAWAAQAISTLTRLNVPDVIHDQGPMTADDLTAQHGIDADPDFLRRVLRACAAIGVFSEDADGRFGPTPLSEVLTLNSADSVKRYAEMLGGEWWGPWGQLEKAVRTGKSQGRRREEEIWNYADDPEGMRRFAETMKSGRESVQGVLAQCDFSDVHLVVDVGGGLGHLAIAILQRYPHVRAIVLDLPDLAAFAEKHNVGEGPDVLSRLTFVGGDMFADVPEADVYILKAIIHDWDDERCVRVLRNCRERMQGEGRVLGVDAVLPPLGDTGAVGAKLGDLNMMVHNPGKERTETEWRALYDAAGLEVVSVRRLGSLDTPIVEGIRR